MTEAIDPEENQRQQLAWLEQWQAEIDALFEQLRQMEEKEQQEADATQTP